MCGFEGATPRTHRQTNAVQCGIAEQPPGRRQQFGLLACDVPLVQIDEIMRLVVQQDRRVSAGHLLQPALQGAPALFEFSVLGGQRSRQLAQAHGVGPGHRFDERRKEIDLLVSVVMNGGGVEVTHQCDCGLLRLAVDTMLGQVDNEAAQGGALGFDAAVTCGEHFQWHFEAHGRRGVPGQVEKLCGRSALTHRTSRS